MQRSHARRCFVATSRGWQPDHELTADAEDLIHSDIIENNRDQAQRQQSRMEEIKVIFFKEEVNSA